jgi:hypothetical protein
MRAGDEYHTPVALPPGKIPNTCGTDVRVGSNTGVNLK